MELDRIPFDWAHARAFLALAEQGSLSAAARALGLTQPTLGRQVRAFEEALGTTLFERTGRALALTAAGEALVPQARAMADSALDISRIARGQADAIEGSIRISATQIAAAYMLPPLLTRLQQEHPGIRVELVSTNSISDLRRREADIAVRSATPDDPELIARKLSDEHAKLYASKAYLERFGGSIPKGREREAHFIGFDDNEPYLEGLRSIGVEIDEAQFSLSSTDHAIGWTLVREGAGIGAMASRIADQYDDVAPAFEWAGEFPFEIWLVSHRELLTSRRVRLVFDWLADALMQE